MYIDAGRDIQVIRSLPIAKIGRFDVWQCVFEKEPEALRELFLKEDYDFCSERPSVEMRNTHLLIVVIRLLQTFEWKLPVTIDDRIQVVVDFYGNECLDVLIDISNKMLRDRKQIVSAYTKPDLEWVNQTQVLVDTLSEIKQRTIELTP
jgi:hypothetical protein